MVSEEILKFSTKESIFSPIEFDVDGIVFVCRRLIPEVMVKQYKYEMDLGEMGKKEDPEGIQKLIIDHLVYLFPDLKKEILLRLENDEVRMIMNKVVVAQMMNRQMRIVKETVKKALKGKDQDSEKNGERPGKKKSVK